MNSFSVGEGNGSYVGTNSELPRMVGSGLGLCNFDPMYMNSGATKTSFTWSDRNATTGQTSWQEDWDSMERVDSYMRSTLNVVGQRKSTTANIIDSVDSEEHSSDIELGLNGKRYYH